MKSALFLTATTQRACTVNNTPNLTQWTALIAIDIRLKFNFRGQT